MKKREPARAPVFNYKLDHHEKQAFTNPGLFGPGLFIPNGLRPVRDP